MSEPSRGNRGRAKKPVVAPRGKGRRSQAEREQLLQQERERNRERERQYAAEFNAARRKAELENQRDGGRGRGRGRGRGGYMGESRPVAGPFSAGSVIAAHVTPGRAFPRPWAPSHRGQRTGSSSTRAKGPAVKREDGVRSKTSIKRDPESRLHSAEVTRMAVDGGYISSDPDEATEGPRKDVETINLISDDENVVNGDGSSEITANKRYNSPANAPIRIRRVEHRDRLAPVNPAVGESVRIKQQDDEGDDTILEPMSAKKSGKQKVSDVQFTGTAKRWKGVWESEEDRFVHVKDEPIEDAENAPSSIAKPAREEETEEGKDMKPKRHHRHHHKNSIQYMETEEEVAEYDREMADLETLVRELGPRPDEAGGDEAAANVDAKKDRVYLFQFPPVIPSLIVPAPIVVKDEPMEGPENNPAYAAPASLSDPPVPIKIEDDARKPADMNRPPHLPILTSGSAGKLRVHQSGKVTLNWGGTSLQLQAGMDSHFLQDIIFVRKGQIAPAEIATGASHRHGEVGEALAFGQVRGKFVVVPDWDEILG